jgi:hypothetical protein
MRCKLAEVVEEVTGGVEVSDGGESVGNGGKNGDVGRMCAIWQRSAAREDREC